MVIVLEWTHTIIATKIGHKPKIILSGRKINNSCPNFNAATLGNKKLSGKTSTLILGATFKEDCKDLRNSKVLDLYEELKNKGHKVDIFDPMFKKRDLFKKILNTQPQNNKYHNIILAVKHDKFKTTWN